MNCPECGTANNFESAGRYVHCTAKVNGELCGYRLSDSEARKYFMQKKMARHRRIRQAINRKYYNKHKEFIDGIFVSEVAMVKKCAIPTVYQHINRFDVVPGSSPLRVKFNKKVLNWEPERKER